MITSITVNGVQMDLKQFAIAMQICALFAA